MSGLPDETDPLATNLEHGVVDDIHAEYSASDKRRISKEMRVMMMSYEGPLPPPAVMEAYNRMVPQGAERLVVVFEAQSTHRRYLERTVVDANVRLQYLGFGAALIIAVLVISGGIFLAYKGMSLGGFAMIVTALVALVSVFLIGKRQQSDERFNKQKNMPKV